MMAASEVVVVVLVTAVAVAVGAVVVATVEDMVFVDFQGRFNRSIWMKMMGVAERLL